MEALTWRELDIARCGVKTTSFVSALCREIGVSELEWIVNGFPLTVSEDFGAASSAATHGERLPNPCKDGGRG